MASTTIQGLPADLIKDLMGSTRNRNVYGPKLLEFVESDEPGINPSESWPLEFGGKNPTTLYQGFIKAAKDAKVSDTVKIIKREDSVFILHMERARVAVETMTTESE